MLPAIVLTAGLGTRLDPITRLVAKAAVPLAGKSLIERVLERLAGQGVTDAVLNLHHRAESITAIVGDGSRLGLRVRYSWESPILGSAGGPRRALPLLDSERFLIVNGDTLCDVDLQEMLAEHVANEADVTMAVVPNPAPDHYNGMEVDDWGRVTAFVPRGQAANTWHFVGIQVTGARVFAELPDGQPAETVAGIYREGVAAGTLNVRAFRMDLPFVDVGTPRDYLTAALSLSGGGNAIEPGALIHPTARLSGSVVWAGATIGPGAVLQNCIVTDVAIPDAFHAQDVVIVPPAVARPEDATIAGNVATFPLTRK